MKGSHIIVPRQYEGDHCYLLQGADGRVVFVIPYEQNFTLIGTTDEEFSGDPYEASLSDTEQDYLIAAFNDSFEASISAIDIVSHYSGVRPLLEDGEGEASAVTRDYKIHSHKNYTNPFVSIFGGKLTTYRTLSDKCSDIVCKMIGRGAKSWTQNAALPGGDFDDFDALIAQYQEKYPQINPQFVHRLARAYGTRAGMILDTLGVEIGEGLYAGEVDYLVRYEWARSAEDILWRRSKLGLHLSAQTQEKLEEYLRDDR